MKSKTSFFSRALFFNTLRRFWPLFAAYLFIWILIFPVQLNSNLAMHVRDLSALNTAELARDIFSTASENILQSAVLTGPLMTAAFAVLFAMASFSCFYNGKSVSAVCALPIKREGLFFSVFLPGPAVMIASNIVVALVTLIVQSVYGAECSAYVLQFFCLVTLQSLFFSGFAAFCASLTGHILILPCVYVILNFVYAVVSFLVLLLFRTFVFGMDTSDYWSQGIFSPLLFMLTTDAVSANYDDMGNVIALNYNLWLYTGICAAVGILLIFAAMRLVKIRRMETAGDVVAFKPLKPLFKYCMCFGCALVLGTWFFYIINGSIGRSQGMAASLILLACMAVGALIGYFAAEMLISKTLHVFAGPRWKGYGISLLAIAALIFLMEFDVFGVERRLPETENVSSVFIMGSGNYFEVRDPELIQDVIDLHGSVISHKALYESSDKPYTYSVGLTYELKNGGSFHRSYELSQVDGGDMDAWNDFFNRPEVILLRKNHTANDSATIFGGTIVYYDTDSDATEEKTLSAAAAEDLYRNCVYRDMQEGTIGLVWMGDTLDENGVDIYDQKYMHCSVEINFTERAQGAGDFATWSFNTTVTVDSAHTLQWLKEQGIEPVTYEKAYTNMGKYETPTDAPATHSYG